MAISNGPIIGSRQVGDGKTAFRFGTTMKMSTYLVAFVVGPFQATEPVDVRGVPLRVVTPRGKLHLSRFALDIGAFALRYFADYFGIPYPAEKLDLIAVPDFAFGAMENLGAVTFRETALLVDETKASKGDLERIADVIAHEIAHMWFGDLVTMRWWNGIWLNEAFATFMETTCVDAWKPEWKRWESFAIERAAAFGVDALQTTRPVEFVVRRPAEANDMFDVLTYEKGCSVLRMLEQYIEPSVFQAGISAYLKRHAYGNTETSDLWDALEEASRAPVRAIMESWIFQAGFPIVSVARVDGGVRLTQSIFRYLGAGDAADRMWQIPVILRVETANGAETRKVLLTDRELVVALPDAQRVVVNAGGSGFYRVRYDDDLLGALRANLASLSAVERYQLIDNTHAASVAGLSPVRATLDLIKDLAATETDRNVWLAMIGAMSYIHRAAPEALRPALRAKYRALLAPIAHRLGWDPAPGETEVERQFRATILNAYGVLADDAATQVTAKVRYARYLDDPTSLDPNLVPTVIDIIAHQGGPEDYAAFDARRKTAATPQDESRYLFALAAFPQRSLLEQTLAKTLTSDVRTQDAGSLIAMVLSNLHGGDLGWRFLRDHWDALQARLPFNAHARMVSGLAGVVDEAIANEAQAFFAHHPPKEGAKQIAQTLERQRVIIAYRGRVAAELPALAQDEVDHGGPR
ncbi:MAG: M1 family aminopeptidase, partial [Dehalococcoidia bacterium]|nr:M1 family aminopeptidase [Dehalococcoidia bacterium]